MQPEKNIDWTWRHLGRHVVITTLLLTKCQPYNPKGATAATALNSKYNEHHITICSFQYIIGDVLRACDALNLNIK